MDLSFTECMRLPGQYLLRSRARVAKNFKKPPYRGRFFTLGARQQRLNYTLLS